MRFNLRRLFSATASVVVIVLIGFVLIRILFPNITTRDDAREELLDFRSRIAVGMDKQQIESVFAESSYRHLKLAKASEALWIIQTPFQTGAVNWELRLAFSGPALTGYYVRTADDRACLPGGAPSDVESDS